MPYELSCNFALPHHLHLLSYLNWTQNQTKCPIFLLPECIFACIRAGKSTKRINWMPTPLGKIHVLLIITSTNTWNQWVQGNPLIWFYSGIYLSWILLCGMIQKEGKATCLICAFKKDKNSRMMNQPLWACFLYLLSICLFSDKQLASHQQTHTSNQESEMYLKTFIVSIGEKSWRSKRNFTDF